MFPSARSVFIDHVVLGIEHILTGLDHLLFLLVVLATGWGWRQVLLALTCFTLGHAVTLTAGIWGGFQVSPDLVEPAIAATIVGMAAYDWIARKRGRVHHPVWRLAAVFACALVHGLGLASSLTDLGLDGSRWLQIVAGFNSGIELGQLVVALAAASLLTAIRALRGNAGLHLALRTISICAMLVGAMWFVQRVVS